MSDPSKHRLGILTPAPDRPDYSAQRDQQKRLCENLRAAYADLRKAVRGQPGDGFVATNCFRAAAEGYYKAQPDRDEERGTDDAAPLADMKAVKGAPLDEWQEAAYLSNPLQWAFYFRNLIADEYFSCEGTWAWGMSFGFRRMKLTRKNHAQMPGRMAGYRAALDMTLDKTAAAPLTVEADKKPDVFPQSLQDVNDVLEQQDRKSPVSPEYRKLVDTTLETYVGQANGHPIHITSENHIAREGKEVKLYCSFLEGDARDGFLVGVALNDDEPARPVYKGPELLAYLELCHKAGIEFRKSMVGKPSVPPFKCQRTGTSTQGTQFEKIIPVTLSEFMTA